MNSNLEKSFSCVHLKNLAELKAWKMAGADLNSADYDKRTPLHIVKRDFIFRKLCHLLDFH